MSLTAITTACTSKKTLARHFRGNSMRVEKYATISMNGDYVFMPNESAYVVVIDAKTLRNYVMAVVFPTALSSVHAPALYCIAQVMQYSPTNAYVSVRLGEECVLFDGRLMEGNALQWVAEREIGRLPYFFTIKKMYTREGVVAYQLEMWENKVYVVHKFDASGIRRGVRIHEGRAAKKGRENLEKITDMVKREVRYGPNRKLWVYMGATIEGRMDPYETAPAKCGFPWTVNGLLCEFIGIYGRVGPFLLGYARNSDNMCSMGYMNMREMRWHVFDGPLLRCMTVATRDNHIFIADESIRMAHVRMPTVGMAPIETSQPPRPIPIYLEHLPVNPRDENLLPFAAGRISSSKDGQRKLSCLHQHLLEADQTGRIRRYEVEILKRIPEDLAAAFNAAKARMLSYDDTNGIDGFVTVVCFDKELDIVTELNRQTQRLRWVALKEVRTIPNFWNRSTKRDVKPR